MQSVVRLITFGLKLRSVVAAACWLFDIPIVADMPMR